LYDKYSSEKMITPPTLKIGDKVALIATAKNFNVVDLSFAIQIMEGWGLRIMAGAHLYNKYHQFAGTDAERAADLQEALNDPEIKALFCARGGYGTARIIDRIDFDMFRKNPKWIVGFSDVTVLHAHLNSLGFETMHAVMPILYGRVEYQRSVSELKNVLFGKPPVYHISSHKLNKDGVSEGRLAGGNLTILHTLLNTSSLFDFTDKILLIEDVGENLYHIDRMMVHFKRTGKLSILKGLIAGHFTDMKDNEIPFGKSAYEIILDAVREYNYPVAFGFPSGHEANNLPVICGRNVRLQVSADYAELDFSTSESLQTFI
jgi:muramoyltetrapeptide carboxypeptidase